MNGAGKPLSSFEADHLSEFDRAYVKLRMIEQ